MPSESKRKQYETLRVSLENERSSFITHWRDLGDYFLPRRIQFTVTDTNRGEKRNNKIINNTSLLAVRTLRSGMMGGVTSPARPWFRLTTPDPALADIDEVKQWLHIVSQRMSTTFLRSNLYNALPILYGDMGTFGTAAMLVEEDFDTAIRCYPFPIGSYSLANDEKGGIGVFFREFRLTVRQIVSKFGKEEEEKVNWDNISSHVKNLYERGTLDAWVDVCHVIHANSDYDPNGFGANTKKYRSVYYEKGTNSSTNSGYTTSDDNTYLRDSGYDYFPVLAPRWEVTGEDVYGTNCPGMIALGDTKSLQVMEKRHAQAVEKKVNPAMAAPTAMKTEKLSHLPGDVTYLDEREGQKGFRAVHDINFQTNELENKMAVNEQRIERAYFVDLFLMLATMDRSQITATEILERKEEKLLSIGPVLEQLNQDLLNPLIDITFDIMQNQGLIPPPPEVLQGVALKVEYISIMHQAQKMAGLGGIDRLMSFVGQAAEFNPTSLDKINIDQTIDEYAEITGVPPDIVNSTEVVENIRASRQQAEQAAEQMELLKGGAGAAKDLSQAETSGGNMLDALVEQSGAGALQ